MVADVFRKCPKARPMPIFFSEVVEVKGIFDNLSYLSMIVYGPEVPGTPDRVSSTVSRPERCLRHTTCLNSVAELVADPSSERSGCYQKSPENKGFSIGAVGWGSRGRGFKSRRPDLREETDRACQRVFSPDN